VAAEAKQGREGEVTMKASQAVRNRKEIFSIIASKTASEKQKDRARSDLAYLHLHETFKGRQPRPGHIYLLRGGDYFKIGFSEKVSRRIRQISPVLPFKVELIHTMETDDMILAERFLHEKYADKRTNGEWFLLEQPDVDWLTSIEHFEVCYMVVLTRGLPCGRKMWMPASFTADIDRIEELMIVLDREIDRDALAALLERMRREEQKGFAHE
jgi:hypothetical protein